MITKKQAAQILNICDSTIRDWEISGELIPQNNGYTYEQLIPFINKSQNIFIEKTKTKYGEDIDFSKVKYVNSRTNIIITCPKHGDFEILPKYLLIRNFFCTICENEKQHDLIKNQYIGQIFGMKKVIDLHEIRPPGARVWKAECQNCGNITLATMNVIKKDSNCRICKGRPKSETGLLFVFHDYKKNSKKRELDFNLTLEEFRSITSQNCHYCGETPTPTRRIKLEYSKYLCNGIDRVDNNKGYIFENCVPCCYTCNSAKMDQTYEEFMEYLNRLTEFYTNGFIQKTTILTPL